MGYDKVAYKARYEANKEFFRAKRRESYKRNRAASIEYSKQYRLNNLEKVRVYETQRNISQGLEIRLRKYGITPDEYECILRQQNDKCAICLSPNTNKRNWHVDHCHDSGQVRGLLCHHCNLLLGNARDNPVILQAAISYLKNPSAELLRQADAA